MNIFNDNIEAFGMDLSDRSIKVAQLMKKDGKVHLLSFARKDIPQGWIEDGEVRKEEEIIDLIKKTLREAKPKPIKSKYVVYSIPETKGFIRVIKIPKIEGENLEEIVKYEAEQLFPIDISESYTDWQVLSGENEKVLEVLVAAVPMKIVDSYSAMFKKVGLMPIAAEIESIAISRSLINERQSSRPILIIDLGKDRTSFIIYKNPTVQFTASIPVCGNEFNKAISETLNLSDSEAEILKRKCGLSAKGECKDLYRAIQPSLHEMVKYINKLSDYYKEHYKEETDIAKVIICGGEARILGISSFLSLRIKKEVEKGNPWVNLILSTDKEIPPISRNDSLIFVTVLGLAIRGLSE